MGCCGCCSASAIDPLQALASVREEAPEILTEGETFEFAFAWSRDQIYFTSQRVLFKDKEGFTGSRVSWQTIPYSRVKAFSVQTAGSLDPDVDVTFWASGLSNGPFTRESGKPSSAKNISFKKSGGVDPFAIQRFLNQKVFNPCGATIELPPEPQQMTAGTGTEAINLMFGDARAIDPKVLESKLKVDPPVLLVDEAIDRAFKCGRDVTAFTSKRLIHINTKGITGKRVQYTSYPWASIKAWSVESPGAFLDRDAEVKIWTSISDCDSNKFELDLRVDLSEVFAVQRYISDKLLGQDTVPLSENANSGAGKKDEGGGWQAWLAGDMRMLDASEQNRKFHEDLQLLQGCETCEMAFKAARDMVLFTTKRLIVIDPQGLTGKKVEYKSLPWSCVQAFAVESPGAWVDKDSEMIIWTDIHYDQHTETEKVGDNDVTFWVRDPGLSYFSIDFQKDKVDLCAVGRYLASRCALLGSQSSQPTVARPYGSLAADPPGMLESFLGWLGNDYRQVDPEELDSKLHRECSMLLSDERVRMGFVCGRDTFILTTHRAMKIDTKGFTGKRVLYLSIPYTKVRSFSVESAGSFDLDAKMELTFKADWFDGNFSIDFGKGRADIVAIQKFMCEQIIGRADGTSVVMKGPPQQQPAGAVSRFLAWLGDDYRQIPTEEVTKQLTDSPSILLDDESVNLAFRCGRDLALFTTKRILHIDTKGFSGQRVLYRSLPYQYLYCFKVRGAAAHPFDQDAEVCLLTDGSDWGFDIRKGGADIMAIYTMLNNKVNMRTG